MATLIFIDKENDEVGGIKSQRRLPSGPSKVLHERTQVSTPLPKKAIGTPPATCQSVRKVLANVNGSGVVRKVEKMGQKNRPCTANKLLEETVGLENSNAVPEDWPEVEEMFPFDPRDSESFELPDDLKLSNINLRGLPLMIFERTYDKPVNMVPSPVKIEEPSWQSSLLEARADFLATLEKIVIDVPPEPDFWTDDN